MWPYMCSCVSLRRGSRQVLRWTCCVDAGRRIRHLRHVRRVPRERREARARARAGALGRKRMREFGGPGRRWVRSDCAGRRRAALPSRPPASLTPYGHRFLIKSLSSSFSFSFSFSSLSSLSLSPPPPEMRYILLDTQASSRWGLFTRDCRPSQLRGVTLRGTDLPFKSKYIHTQM